MTRSHLVWGLVGAAYAATLLGLAVSDAAVSVGSAIGLFATIAATFVVWRLAGGRTSWVAMVVCGVAMSATLTWATATRQGCPAKGQVVQLKEGKPPVSCDEVRAGYLAMASFFYVLTAIGVAMPFVARRAALDSQRARQAHLSNGSAPPAG